MKKIYTLAAALIIGLTANAQTYLTLKDFQDQSITSGGWQSFVITSTPGSHDWGTQDLGSAGNFYAIATGWNGSGADETELWLVSPSFDLTTATAPELNFRNAENFGGPALELHISTDYDGTSDPTTQGTWTDISSMVNWSTGGFAWVNGGPVNLSAYNTNGSVYIAFVYTSNSTDGASSWELDDIEITEPTPATVVSVYDIQNATGDSPYMGQNVETGGIVTAVNADGYSIQAGTGAYSGVWVEDATGAASVNRGDSLTLTADVDELFSFTILENVSNMTVVSSGNTEPMATSVSTLGANAEEWEGTKIMVSAATCTLDNDGFGQWVVTDGTGNLLVDDEIYDYPTPTINDIYNVTGIGWYSFSEFKLQARDANDVEVITSTPDADIVASVYPNPVQNNLIIETSSSIESIAIYSLDGQLVMNVVGNATNLQVINTADLANGVYSLVVSSNNKKSVVQLVK